MVDNNTEYVFPTQCYDCSSENIIIENKELKCLDCHGVFVDEKS